MCGRYFVDDETANEIRKLVKRLDDRMRGLMGGFPLRSKDIYPSELAPVIVSENKDLCCRLQRWGFSSYDQKKLIINARCESVLEKRMFRDGAYHRRIIIPAAGFYEWSKNKEKNTFYQKERPVLYMAGLYNQYQNESRFVILTTAANESMKQVHDRMPLLLDRKEIVEWLTEDQKINHFLQKKPGPLERKTEYEQMSLFSNENSK